jgi:peptidoglycan/LPS O-acetylase OafA/YrhL
MRAGISGQGERSGALDALRGLAIALVVSFHWLRFPIGWTGVDLFFVLSGYLIGGILIDNRDSANYFSTFYGRRAFRILPLYAIFLATSGTLFGLSLSVWRYLTFTQNFAWVHGGLALAGITGLTWSLAIEEQFYFVLPILVRALPSKTLLALCCVVITSAPFCRWLLIHTLGMSATYVLLPGRMDTLFAGVLIACIARRPEVMTAIRQRLWVVWTTSGAAATGFLAIGLSTPHGFVQLTATMVTVGYSLVAVAFGCLLTGVVAGGWQPSRNFPLRFLGLGAYSVYLFHQMVGVTVVGLTGAPGWLALPLAGGAVAALSAFCWSRIERPCILWAKSRWRYDGHSHRITPQLAAGD